MTGLSALSTDPDYMAFFHYLNQGLILRPQDYWMYFNWFLYCLFAFSTQPRQLFTRLVLTFCVETTYSAMGSDIYQQKEGLAKGSPGGVLVV